MNLSKNVQRPGNFFARAPPPARAGPRPFAAADGADAAEKAKAQRMPSARMV